MSTMRAATRDVMWSLQELGTPEAFIKEPIKLKCSLLCTWSSSYLCVSRSAEVRCVPGLATGTPYCWTRLCCKLRQMKERADTHYTSSLIFHHSLQTGASHRT